MKPLVWLLLMGFLSDSKDRVLETMALPILNRSFLIPFAKASSLRIDSTNKTAELVLNLKGEPDPVRIRIDRYEVTERGDEAFVTLHGLNSSREWLTALAERFVLGRPLKLPPEFSSLLCRLI